MINWVATLGLTCVLVLINSKKGYSETKSQDLDLPRFSGLLSDKYLTGLNLESLDDQERIRRYTKEFIQFERHRLTSQQEDNLIDDCEDQAETLENPFCVIILNHEKIERNKDPKRLSRSRRRAFIRKWVQAVKLGKIEELKDVSSSDLGDVFKKISSLIPLYPIIEKALAEKECLSTALTYSLGLRLEFEFPEEDFKTLSTLLYQRAQKCGKDSSSYQASYRLGLMQIWDGNYKDAESTLSQIDISVLDPSYRMRIAYWRFYCATQMKNLALKDQLQKWLFKEYPLSLHGLLANSEGPAQSASVVRDQDPIISFRCQRNQDLNSIVRAVEGLIREKELKLASDLLIANSTRVEQLAESSFQLYWAVLLERTGERTSSFNLMAKIFKENPSLMSKEALGLMYPLQQSKPIEELVSAVDPFLVLSVIRQESAFNEKAKSPAGALGLMQMRLSTARTLERISKSQLWKPQVNIRVGVKYLKGLLRSFDGEVELALAAYNAGPGRIREWLKRYPVKNNRLLFLDLLPIRETRDYVSSIARNYYWYSKLYENAFSSVNEGKKRIIQGPNLLSASKPVSSVKPLATPLSDLALPLQSSSPASK